MEFPKLDFNKPESFIAVYVPLIVAITVIHEILTHLNIYISTYAT
jgi:hypothetical protein